MGNREKIEIRLPDPKVHTLPQTLLCSFLGSSSWEFTACLGGKEQSLSFSIHLFFGRLFITAV